MPMPTCKNTRFVADRRGFLRHTAAGFGALALSALQSRWSPTVAAPYAGPLAPKPTHIAPRAKRVIFLFMEGGPSHIDTFDWKPELAAMSPGGRSRPLPPVAKFAPCGKSGLMLASELFPNLARHADDLCLLHGVQTKNNGHMQSIAMVHTGTERFVRPSLGSWTLYGLGTESEDLPGFVTLDPITHNGGAQLYGSAFLPAVYQGTRLTGGRAGMPNIANTHLAGGDQRRQLDYVRRLNQAVLADAPANPEIEGLIESYELAFKMQSSVPQTFSFDEETDETLELYGVGGDTDRFGRACLTARRLVERGVRFIQLTSTGWDHHNNLREGLAGRFRDIDKPIAGLLADLKRRDLLKDTLVLWGGEFGRGSSDDKGDGDGRGHNGQGFTMWMAGGGVKGGFRYGATDEIGGRAVEGIMSVQDLHATILHLLGLDHERLTFRYAGRDFRLTETSGEVAHKIFA
jgi:hypothetical protein